jgi:hypothetical protein
MCYALIADERLHVLYLHHRHHHRREGMWHMLLVDERLHDPYGTCSLPTNNCTIRIYNNAFLPMFLALEIAS